MFLKDLYQKNSTVTIWGIIGFSIGVISAVLMFTPLPMLGLTIGIVSLITWSFFVNILFHTQGSAYADFADVGYGFLILTPFLYLIIGLLIGWVISKISAYAFGKESGAGVAISRNIITGGVVGMIVSSVLVFIISPIQFQSIQDKVQHPIPHSEYTVLLTGNLLEYGFVLMFIGALMGLVIGIIIAKSKQSHG